MRPVLTRPPGWWPRLFVAVCVALVLISGTVQVAHFHPNGRIDPDCALCVTAHSAAHIVHPVAISFTSHAIEILVPPRRIRMPRTPVFIRLVSRPPPAQSALFV